jgi:acyl carrier protein
VPAGTEQERRIAEIWQELLGIKQIGIHDDFFELGGHSLMIVSVHNRLQQTLNVTFPVAKMFQYPTINALANCLRQGQDNKPSYENLRDRAKQQRERQRQLVKEKGTDDR